MRQSFPLQSPQKLDEKPQGFRAQKVLMMRMMWGRKGCALENGSEIHVNAKGQENHTQKPYTENHTQKTIHRNRIMGTWNSHIHSCLLGSTQELSHSVGNYKVR